jgi:hypothetical protein
VVRLVVDVRPRGTVRRVGIPYNQIVALALVDCTSERADRVAGRRGWSAALRTTPRRAGPRG